MDVRIKYQGKIVTRQDIDFINRLISNNPEDSRRTLSKRLCKEWNWVQPNGVLRDMFCRGFMLHLESAGQINLPPRKCTPNNPFVNRKRPLEVEIDQTPIETPLANIQPLEIRQVRYTPDEKLFNSLISQYHYLGYCHPVGEHLKYMVYSQRRPIACFAWSSAARHIGSRDKFIGWSPDVRKKNIHLIAYNMRFLILPWIRLPHLASHLLSRMVKVLPYDWEKIYNHPLYFLENVVAIQPLLCLLKWVNPTLAPD